MTGLRAGLSLVLVALLVNVGQAQFSQWPLWYHEAQNTSATEAQLGGDYLALEWVVPATGSGDPLLVAQGLVQTVFVGNMPYSADDGQPLTSSPLPGIRPAAGGGRVFLYERLSSSQSAVYAHDLDLLGPDWATSVPYTDYRLTTRGNGLYAICRYGLRKLDGGSGDELWATEAFPYLARYPAVADVTIDGTEYEAVFVGCGVTNRREFPEHRREYSVYAFNAANGEILWKKWTGTGMFGLSVDPALGLVYGGEWEGDCANVYVLDADDGSILDVRDDPECSRAVVVETMAGPRLFTYVGLGNHGWGLARLAGSPGAMAL